MMFLLKEALSFKVKKVLFLDDNKYRHKLVKQYLCHDEAYNINQAYDFLKNRKYDLVFLDYDLENNENGGMITDWIIENKIDIPYIIIHSLNLEGAEEMRSKLRASGYHVHVQKFSTLKDIITQFMD